MSGPTYFANRSKNTVFVHLCGRRKGEQAAREAAAGLLEDSEFMTLREREGYSYYTFTVVS